MFGSTNPFGQSSSSPFGSQSVFGQTSNSSTNPFAPKPFGSPNAFGSQTGSSIFGGTSTGVFGQPSTPAFGASSSPAFGSSTPAFGSSSTPAFGSSLFGQKPAFGSFGSSSSQSSPFGSATQQTQPAFGSNLFGSTSPFGASSQPAFGASSQPAFGASSTSAFGSTPSFGSVTTSPFGTTSSPAFGATNTPAFGSTATPAFGSTSSTPAFGSTTTPVFGSTGTSFGVSSTPAFGSSVTPSFGAPSASVFGSANAPAFGASTAPTFGSPTVPAFGASNTPSFSFSSAPSFGPSSPAFGSTQFGTTSSPFGAQSSPFSAQATTPTFGSPGFGQTSFGGQAGGTRITGYTPTPEVDGATGTQPAGKLDSISAMPAYKDKSHEELRWEDYQRGDKGGPNPSAQPTGGIGFNTASQPSPFGSTGTFGQSAANPFSSVASNPFAPKPQGFGTSSSSLFSSTSGSSSTPLGSTPATTPLFGSSTVPTFGSSSSPFGTTAPSFTSSSIFGSSLAGSTPSFGALGNTQSSGLFQSSAPSFPQTSPFGQSSTGFQQTASAFGSNISNTQSTGFTGGLFSSSTPFQTSTPSGFGQAAASLQTPFAPQTSNAFSFPNFGQSQPASASSGGFGSSSIFSPGNFSQPPATQSSVMMQPTPVTNPFGTLPATPVMSIGRAGSSPSIQYGISTMPVSEKPMQARSSAILVPRHISQRRIKLPPRKFNPKTDGLMVPFYSENGDTPSTPKADALFIRRENPRSLIIRPIEQWPPRNGNDKPNVMKEAPVLVAKDGNVIEPSAPAFDETYAIDHERNPTQNGHVTENDAPPKEHVEKVNGVHNGDVQKGADSPYAKIHGHTAAEATNVHEHGTGIEAQMPKLRHSDYYTEPSIQELAAKERAEPGFCSRVKDFVVGRHSYGSIKFFGETDVRRLDVEAIVQLNNREVIVYMDETRKPPVGHGLNKPAEVTLLNIKCINKKTGKQHTEGAMVEKYKELLLKKTQEQGAEFLSYDAVKGEWKFKVKHFSRYEFVKMDEDNSKS